MPSTFKIGTLTITEKQLWKLVRVACVGALGALIYYWLDTLFNTDK